jgi:hypothetical protein
MLQMTPFTSVETRHGYRKRVVPGDGPERDAHGPSGRDIPDFVANDDRPARPDAALLQHPPQWPPQTWPRLP